MLHHNKVHPWRWLVSSQRNPVLSSYSNQNLHTYILIYRSSNPIDSHVLPFRPMFHLASSPHLFTFQAVALGKAQLGTNRVHVIVAHPLTVRHLSWRTWCVLIQGISAIACNMSWTHCKLVYGQHIYRKHQENRGVLDCLSSQIWGYSCHMSPQFMDETGVAIVLSSYHLSWPRFEVDIPFGNLSIHSYWKWS